MGWEVAGTEIKGYDAQLEWGKAFKEKGGAREPRQEDGVERLGG